MKKILVLSVFILFVVGACNDETDPFTFGLGTETGFKTGLTNISNDNSLNFRIVEINDSRCPSDVVCVWAGKADVKIEVTSPQKTTFTLNTTTTKADTVGNYVFNLVSVSPYPISTRVIKTEEYDVKLKIVKL